MQYVCKPERIRIYINRDYKSIDQIKAETGADVIINGGLYDMSNFKAVCHLKADGVIYAADIYKYFGYGWNVKNIHLTSDYSKLDNFICCVCMIREGKAEKMLYPANMGGARPRTAIGLYPDGRVWFYASSDKKTPESLQSYALSLGLDSAIMLDGGGSTQGIAPSGSFRQQRKCHNYICAWLSANPCPYNEPSGLIARGNRGDGTRWIQWQLNRHGYSLVVDGIYGGLTYAAVTTFQTSKGLVADGVVGSLTRAALREDKAAPEIISPAYAWSRAPSKRATTQYIILHHAGVSSATPEAIHNYHKSLGWCGIGYNIYISKAGKIYNGRPLDCIGAHTVGYNSSSVGICFEGNFEVETMSPIQIAAGKRAVEYVKSYYPSAQIKLHKECDATACPGKNFPVGEFR